ncbi:hypothetical protein SAMN05660324_2341 [Klenkia brasiliensis]|uniref:SipW-cognate class signal peptide n=2 Tax=Klenkia brasiliensis TaxID=333142 RepID=A0A1G7T7V0_9ACTN|nr:hypothetical protein SAMN05660324_2341 [Klenkia brasiliensis]
MTKPSNAAPRSGRRRSLNGLTIQLAAVALTFLLVALLVASSSYAAFVATTDNTADTVTSGGVALSDNDSGSAMFASEGPLTPGNNLSRCIDVTYTGTVNPGPVYLYSAGVTGDAGTYFNLTVEVGPDTADAFGNCSSFSATSTLYTGTIAAFQSSKNSYATGISTWDPAASGETRTFRFTVSVANDQNAQNRTTNFGFTWETRSA